MGQISEELEIEGKSVIRRLAGLARALATGKAVILKNGQIAKIRTGKGRQHPDARCYGVYTDREGKKWLTLGPIQWQIDRSLTLCTLICMAYMVFRFSKHEARVLIEYVDRTNPYMGKFCDRRDADKEYDRQVQQLVEKVEKGEINPGGIFSVLQVLYDYRYHYKRLYLRFVPTDEWEEEDNDNRLPRGAMEYNDYVRNTLMERYKGSLYAPSADYLRKQLRTLARLGLVLAEPEEDRPCRAGRPPLHYRITVRGTDLLEAYYTIKRRHKIHLHTYNPPNQAVDDLITLWYYSLNNDRFRWVVDTEKGYVNKLVDSILGYYLFLKDKPTSRVPAVVARNEEGELRNSSICVLDMHSFGWKPFKSQGPPCVL